ncbi:MAG: hypothetical protein BJ554DRAFT_802, partial [Olpidium bornovanus]
MPRLGIALGSVFFKKSQGKEQWSSHDGHVGPRDRQRSPLAQAPTSPQVSPPAESLASEPAGSPARQFGRGRLSASLYSDGVRPIDTFSLQTGEPGGERGPPATRRNTFSMARTFVRSGGRRWARGNGGSSGRRDSSWSATRSEGGRQSHSRSSSQSPDPGYEAVARDISSLKRELRRLKAAQSDELFDQAQRRHSTRRAAQRQQQQQQQEAELRNATTVRREHAESERVVASLRSELGEAMAFAQQWAQAAAKAEAELDRRRSQNEADVANRQDFEAMGRALAEQQVELAAAKAQLEVWRQKAAEASARAPASPSPAAGRRGGGHDDAAPASGPSPRSPVPPSPLGGRDGEERDGATAAPGSPAARNAGDVTAMTEWFDDKHAAMIMERWQIADADSVQLEILSALLTTEDALRETRTKLGRAEADCAAWEERFADMEDSLKSEVLRYKRIAEAAEAQVEELRSRTERRPSPPPEAPQEPASSSLRQAEIRRAEEAREAIQQALEASEARRIDAVDPNRVLETQRADLSARCQAGESGASQNDENIASLSADLGRSLASAEESLGVIEVAAEDRERKLSALRSQLETAEIRAKEAEEELARPRSAADEENVEKRDGEIMRLRFALEELGHLMDLNLWELRQKAMQLDAAPDWQNETRILLDKVRAAAPPKK